MMQTIEDGTLLEHAGRKFRVDIEPDPFMDPPWDNGDGHGPVTGWTNRPKEPGERVLNQDRNSARYYDFAQAVRIARRDGWSCKEIEDRKAHGEHVPPGEQAAAAAEADFQFLRAWCNDEWHYIAITVHLICSECGGTSPEHFASLCGVESIAGEHIEECARELAAEVLAQMQQAAA